MGEVVAGAMIFFAGILIGWVMVKSTYDSILHAYDDKDENGAA